VAHLSGGPVPFTLRHSPRARSLRVVIHPDRGVVVTVPATRAGRTDGERRAVQFLGERKDVAEVIQCYDAFLLTSVIEGMPNAVMESQLLDVPVIATRAGGTVDLIRDGETGLLASIGDYQALASCIVRLFTHDGLWGRISLAAAKQIREGYTIEQLVTRTEAVYQNLLDPNAERISVPCAE